MNPVIHFEMPAEDRKRISNFYTQAFGWQTQQLGAEMGEYVLATTTESDENGRPKTPAQSTEVFFKKQMIFLHNIPRLLSEYKISRNK